MSEERANGGDTPYRDWLAVAVAGLGDAVERSDPTAPVPPCPGWTVTSLLEHVVGIHRWVVHILGTGRSHPGETATAPDTDAAGLGDWYRAEAARMQTLMAGADPDAPCWNFAKVNMTYGFWPRRQTHEVTVHTFDALSAGGTELAIEPGVAADGIDELLTVFGPRMAARGQPADLAASIAIVASDVDRAWTLDPPGQRGGAVVVQPGVQARAVATISGSASDLLLAAWKRLPAERLTFTGDVPVAEAYFASALAP